MKIQAIDFNTNKPLAFVSIRLVIKNRNSGFLRVKTDGHGYFELNDIYSGEKIGGTMTNVPGKWIIAAEGAKLTVEFEPAVIHKHVNHA